MAKDSATTVEAAPKAKPPKPKSAVAILQNCLAQLENHPDAKIVAVNRCAPRERVWYDTPNRDQEEMNIRVVIRIK